MPPSQKKVIVRYRNNSFQAGYLSASEILTADGDLDLLDLEGRTLPVPLTEVRWVAYVRDFNRDDPRNPERLMRTTFLSRPRSEGLWVRITFAIDDQLEGLCPLDVSLLDAMRQDAGLFLTPPDDRTNTHRVYVPRAAIAALELLAVVTTPSRTGKASKAEPQPTLFPSS